MNKQALRTLLQHLGEDTHFAGAVTPPIFQTSLFVFKDIEAFADVQGKPYEPDLPDVYSRISNPNLDQVEVKLAALEHQERARVFASGMAAISAAIMACTHSGAHVIADETVYGPTQEFLRDYLPRFGVETTFVDARDIESVASAFRPNTTLLYIESPGSILFRILDIEALCKIAHERGAKVVHDNSYSAGVFQQPSDFGVDIVVHSATKYLCGHSDVVAGALACSTELHTRLMVGEVALLGGTLPPFPAWLMLRGMRTLYLRMKAAQEVGNQVASYLRDKPQVLSVNHVDEHHERAELIQKQMSGSASLLSFHLKEPSAERVHRFVNSLRIFQIGVSWGGFESLIVPIHLKLASWEEPVWTIRLYCGLEDPADLIADLEAAFAAMG